MEQKEILDRFTEYVNKVLGPLADAGQYPSGERHRAAQYERLIEDARWVYRRLSAGGDALTILQRFQSSKVRTGAEGKALQRLIDEVRR